MVEDPRRRSWKTSRLFFASGRDLTIEDLFDGRVVRLNPGYHVTSNWPKRKFQVDSIGLGRFPYRSELPKAPSVSSHYCSQMERRCRCSESERVELDVMSVKCGEPSGSQAADCCGPDKRHEPIELFASMVQPIARDMFVSKMPPVLQRLSSVLPQEPAKRLFAVIDGVIGLDLAMQLKQVGSRLFTLFDGELARDAAQSGPILVEAPEDRAVFLARWADRAGARLGILLLTYAGLPVLFAHLRHIFVVQDHAEKEYFFRFYDPRVLRTFLPTCDETERTEFFGPIQDLVTEAPAGDFYEVWSRNAKASSKLKLPGSPQAGTSKIE